MVSLRAWKLKLLQEKKKKNEKKANGGKIKTTWKMTKICAFNQKSGGIKVNISPREV